MQNASLMCKRVERVKYYHTGLADLEWLSGKNIKLTSTLATMLLIGLAECVCTPHTCQVHAREKAQCSCSSWLEDKIKQADMAAQIWLYWSVHILYMTRALPGTTKYSTALLCDVSTQQATSAVLFVPCNGSTHDNTAQMVIHKHDYLYHECMYINHERNEEMKGFSEKLKQLKPAVQAWLMFIFYIAVLFEHATQREIEK